MAASAGTRHRTLAPVEDANVAGPMAAAENEKLILAMWEDYDREGLPGILRWAAPTTRAGGRIRRAGACSAAPRSTAPRSSAPRPTGVRVESVRLGMWSHDDVGRRARAAADAARRRARRHAHVLAAPRARRQGRLDVVVARPRRAAGGGRAGPRARPGGVHRAAHARPRERSPTTSAPARRAWRPRRATCGSTRTRSSRTRARCPRSRRPRRTSRAPTTRPAPRSASSSTRSTSAPAGSPRCASRRACPGFRTVEAGLRRRGPWTARRAASASRDAEIAETLGQDPEHDADGPLRAPPARARERDRRLVPGLRAVRHRRGARDRARDAGTPGTTSRPTTTSRSRSSSAPRSPPPTSRSPGWPTPTTCDRLTLFADNLVPHVLRLDGVLHVRRRPRRAHRAPRS